jgi:hypothetical protein
LAATTSAAKRASICVVVFGVQRFPSIPISLRRREAERVFGTKQEGLQDLLRLGPQEDDSLAPEMLRLVLCRPVLPDGAALVNVAASEDHHLARTGTREELKLDHGSDLTRSLLLHALDEFLRNRANGLRLGGAASAILQAGDSLEPMEHRRRDEFLGYGPLEHPFDDADLPVDVPAIPAGADHLLADRLQCSGTELCRVGATVERLQRTKCQRDIRGFGRRFSIPDVVAARPREELVGHLDNADLKRIGG